MVCGVRQGASNPSAREAAKQHAAGGPDDIKRGGDGLWLSALPLAAAVNLDNPRLLRLGLVGYGGNAGVVSVSSH